MNFPPARPEKIVDKNFLTWESCSPSSRFVEYRGEICLHFPGGLESLNKPQIWMTPQVIVCLDCGLAQFTVPEPELKLIEQESGTKV